jgi:hypothetical protein
MSALESTFSGVRAGFGDRNAVTMKWGVFKESATWTVLGPLLGFCALLAYFLIYRVGDLAEKITTASQRLEEVNTDLRTDMHSMSADLHDHLKAVSDDVTKRLGSEDLAIHDIRMAMAVFCGHRGPSCTQKLVTQAKSSSQAQAQLVDTAAVTLTTGTEPKVVSEEIKDQLPEMPPGVVGVTTYYATQGGVSKIAKVILWSNAAESSHWYQDGDMVKTSFVNGDVSLKMKPSAKGQVAEFVESLNATATALKTSEKTGPPP